MKKRTRAATHTTSLALIVVAGCAAWTLLVVALWARHRPQADADEDGDRRPRTAEAVFEEAWRKASARERSQLESLGFSHGHALAVASRLRSGDAVWEWGSGGSGTGFFFGRFVRAWHGVVSERPSSYSWRAKGVVQLRHVKLDGGNSVASYVDAIAKDALPCFDRVLVDGTARAACAQRALRSLCNKTDSLVIVHDFYDPARASEHSAMLKHFDIVESFPAEGTGIVFLAPRH